MRPIETKKKQVVYNFSTQHSKSIRELELKPREEVTMKSYQFSVLILMLFTLAGSATYAHEHEKSVANAADKVCPIKVGEALPNISLTAINGKAVAIGDLVKSAPSVLIFYRGSWCPYCNTQLGELQTKEAELKQMGYQIIAISPDLPENLAKSVKQNELSYILLSDSKANLAKAMGLAFKVDDKTNEILLSYKIDLAKASGEKHRILPVPAAVIVGKDQVVDFIHFSPDYKIRIAPEVLVAAAKAAL